LIGLLAKAKQLRGGREEIVFDPDSGISREEQKEVLQEIDGITTQNRMMVTPDLFKVHAVKRGVLFPLVVIAAAVFASGLGVLTFYLLFQQGETQLTSEQGASITAEGKLIEQVKKESAARLEAKNQQINDIQGRLAEIDKERRDLQSNMDAKVGQKEQELRATLAQELDAERAKLQKQGLSDQAIEKRLQDLEAQKNAETARQLESFRQQAEADRAKAEQNLKSLETQFNANLAKANTERQQVLADSRKREEDLRSQLEQKTQVLESEKARAQQALNTLATRQEQEDLVSGQLIGLYAVARGDIAQRNYPKALQSLKAVGNYVNSQDVAALPGIAKRRAFDLFVVDSLTALVQGEMDKGNADTAPAAAPPSQVAELGKLVGDADALLKSGKTDEAEKTYGQALQLIPEISRAYGYFVKRDQDTEDARKARLQDQLTRAETAFDAGRVTQAVAAYRDALAYLPETPQRIDRILSNISAAGADGAQKPSPAQERDAAAALSRARGLQSQGSLDDALAAYLQVISRYPQSAQVDGAVQGIQGTVKSMNEKAAADTRKAEADLGAQITALQADLVKARQQASDAAARQPAVSAAGQPAAPNASAGLSAADAQRLKDFQDRFSALDQAYRTYTSREDPVLSDKGDKGLVDTKTYLDSFLGSRPLEGEFPGLLDRIKRYNDGFQSAGRSDALQDALDVVIQLSRQKAPDKRQKILDDQLKSFRKDAEMTGFLKELQGLLK
jgi:hypothetical protein